MSIGSIALKNYDDLKGFNLQFIYNYWKLLIISELLKRNDQISMIWYRIPQIHLSMSCSGPLVRDISFAIICHEVVNTKICY